MIQNIKGILILILIFFLLQGLILLYDLINRLMLKRDDLRVEK